MISDDDEAWRAVEEALRVRGRDPMRVPPETLAAMLDAAKRAIAAASTAAAAAEGPIETRDK